jgi:tetratricopeptide (TPR) repeat protein
MMRSCSSLVLGFAVLALSVPASAEKGLSRSASERAAKKACSVGDYQKGVDILGDLFASTDDSNYVFNQARCYQQSNQWPQAISRFQEFLRKAKDLSATDRAVTERHIADCEAALAKTVQPVPVVRTETPAPEPTPPPAISTNTTPSPAPSYTSSPGKGIRTAGIICAAVGVAAVATGVGLAVKTQSLASDAQSSGGATQAQEDERKSLVTWGWVSYGFGAAAIATGVVLYVVGWSSDKSTNVSLLPAVAPNGAAMILRGSY